MPVPCLFKRVLDCVDRIAPNQRDTFTVRVTGTGHLNQGWALTSASNFPQVQW